MKMKKTGLALAVTAAALFVAGCATQGANAPQNTPAATCPTATPTANACKGVSHCKTKKCNTCNVDDQGSN